MKLYNLNEALRNKDEVLALHLFNHDLKEVPREIFSFPRLKTLDLSRNSIKSLPPEISQLKQLESLEIRDNQLECLPPELKDIPSLKLLNVSGNNFTEIPNVVFEIDALENLNCSNNKIEAIPSGIKNLVGLKLLNLNVNCIKKLPKELGFLTQLRSVFLSENKIGFIPVACRKWKKLRLLNITKNRLKNFPDFFEQWSHLQKLFISHNRIARLPEGISKSISLRLLHASHNKLESIPERIGEVPFLDYLNLGNNKIAYLPYSLQHCRHLQELNLSYNALEGLPDIFIKFSILKHLRLQGNALSKTPTFNTALRSLDLSNNNLTDFNHPELRYLDYLNVSNNKLTRVPEAFKNYRQLRNLLLSNNLIEEINEPFFYLKNLETLHCDLDTPEIRKLLKLLGTIRRNEVPFRLRSFFFKFFTEQKDAWKGLSLEDIFSLMDSGVDSIYWEGRKLLFNKYTPGYQKQAISEGSSIFFVGKTYFDIKETRSRMEKSGAFCDKVLNEKTTHIVLGRRPFIFDKQLESGKIFINERELTIFLDNAENRWLAASASKKDVEKLRSLLLNDDDANVSLAVQMMKGGGVPQALLTELLIAYKNTDSSNLKKELRVLLDLNCSNEAKAVLRLPFGFKRVFNKKMLLNLIEKFTTDNEFDAEKMKAYYLGNIKS